MSRSALDACIREALAQYLDDLGDTKPSGLHALFMDAAEKPLLESVLARNGGNQSRAAEWLGINRNTLRRKLIAHGLADPD